MVDISIVIPVYFNENSVSKTINGIYERVISKQKNYAFEIICIDDGSKDKSFDALLRVKEEYRDLVTIVKFTRNFGQVQAMMAGYKLAKGKCVINISADLQDPPDLMITMIDSYFSKKIPIIIGTRHERNESFYRRTTSKMFYRLMRSLTFPDMPLGGFDFALLGREVVEFLLESTDSNPFWQGQILWTGFPVKFIPYSRLKRSHDKSRWTFGMKMKYLFDGVLGYSYFPLRLMSVLGIILFLSGIIYSIVILINFFFHNLPFKGWAPIMILLLTLSGIQMLMLGIIGEYLWRTLDQVRKRPGYIIETVIF